jgi:hypothetical protein
MKSFFKLVPNPSKEDINSHSGTDKAIILVAAIITLIGGFLVVSPPDFSVLDRVPVVPSHQQLEAQRQMELQEQKAHPGEVLVPIYGSAPAQNPQ